MNKTKKILAGVSMAGVMSGVLITSSFAQNNDQNDTSSYMHPYIGVLSENDWANLSMKEIDAKAKAAGKPAPYAGLEDFGIYSMTSSEIEKLTDAQWDKIHADYQKARPGVNFGDSFVDGGNIDYAALSGDTEVIVDEYAGILTDTDWQTLSMKQIDEKIVAAGKPQIYKDNVNDPLYNITLAEMEKFTKADWEKIDAEYTKMYPDAMSKY